MSNHIIVLGGDGYLGWPTAMYFSKRGFAVTVVDNYMRRQSCIELNTGMLYSVPTLIDRAKIWNEITGLEIKVVIGDLREPSVMNGVINGLKTYSWALNPESSGLPDAVIHYAEQPSAPFSLIDHEHADLTLINNLRVTNNLIWAVKKYSKECHIVKLGTMGEYGTPNIDIEEGWLDVNHNGRTQKFLYPRQASSLYHTTKIMDTDLLWFSVRTWGLKVTDLMQGPVWGIETEESELDPRLRTIFNYDEIFGTVVNRFAVQSVIGYPLTIYGKGGQTRGYLNINDTLQCVMAAVKNPPNIGEMNIFNQIMETFSVNDLASLTKDAAEELGISVTIKSIDNPRKELEEHFYNPKYSSLLKLGVEPNFLDKESMKSLINTVKKYKNNISSDIIFKGIKW